MQNFVTKTNCITGTWKSQTDTTNINFPWLTSYASFIPPLSAMFSFKVCSPFICKAIKRNNIIEQIHTIVRMETGELSQ